MDSGSYAACTGLLARSQQLDLAAQDLANANTSGYRSQQSSFRSVLARSSAAPNTWSADLNSFGVLGETRVNRAPGNLENTGNPLDLGVEGDGYFAIQTPAGERYTRNGQFAVSSTSMLVTRDGYLVLGTQGPIRIPAGALSVSADGSISVDGALAGQVRLVQFNVSTPLRAEGANYYAAPAGGAAPVDE